MRSSSSSDHQFSWAIPVMRAGYSGRAAIYLIIASLSLWGIWRGGGAKGTSDALAQLEGSAIGVALLVLIGLGMLCYGVWRLVDAGFDLEDHGNDGTGIVARLGMLVTGLIHLGLAGLVAALLLNIRGSGGDGSAMAKAVGNVMSVPGGRIAVGLSGLLTIGAGLYYIAKGWRRSYEKHLRANRWTTPLSPVLRAGLIAQGVIIIGIGALFSMAALNGDPETAGGLAEVFSWAYSTPWGWLVVAAICLGLLGFSLFCAVNAIWRVVPRIDGPDIETLTRQARAKAAG